jgi:hypothetical protein
MQKPRTAEPDRRIATRRRAKRGLVAGYIHEISARHAAPKKPDPAPRLLAQEEAPARV